MRGAARKAKSPAQAGLFADYVSSCCQALCPCTRGVLSMWWRVSTPFILVNVLECFHLPGPAKEVERIDHAAGNLGSVEGEALELAIALPIAVAAFLVPDHHTNPNQRRQVTHQIQFTCSPTRCSSANSRTTTASAERLLACTRMMVCTGLRHGTIRSGARLGQKRRSLLCH